MYTENQAREKWCPEAREWSFETTAGIEQMIVHNESAKCKGSGCMMWRWHRGVILTDQTSKFDERLRKSATVEEATSNPPLSSEMDSPKGAGWESIGVPFPQEEGEGYWLQNWTRQADPERPGYCGLAGNPTGGIL